MDFLIPKELVGAFVGEYGTWCVTASKKFLLIYDPLKVVLVAHNPNVTTNAANPIPNPERIRIDDANGTFDEFADAFPRWKQYGE